LQFRRHQLKVFVQPVKELVECPKLLDAHLIRAGDPPPQLGFFAVPSEDSEVFQPEVATILLHKGIREGLVREVAGGGTRRNHPTVGRDRAGNKDNPPDGGVSTKGEPTMHQGQSSQPNRQEELTKLMRVIYVMAPALQEVLLWIPYYYKEDGYIFVDGGIAYATQKAIYFLPKFFELPPKEQIWVILHEMWHVALRHADRARHLRAHPLIANMAMDVLINEGLKETVRRQRQAGREWLKMPKDGLDIEWLKKETGKDLGKDWSECDWYEIYKFLLQNLPRDEQDGVPIDQSYFEDIGELVSGLVSVRKPENFDGDLERQEDSSEESENEEVKEETWRSRIRRAQAGEGSLGVISPFIGMLPKDKELPWYQLYKRYLLNWGLRANKEVTYARPHRRYLSGVNPFLMPSQVSMAGLLPVTVVFDTSGSVSDQDLELFSKHTDDFRRAFENEVQMWLVMVDCEVQDVVALEPGRTLLSYLKEGKVKYKGRGGTDFVPGLKKAAELGTKLCVYFTDLEGDWGKKPRGMDVLWVVTGSKKEKPPFGRCLYIGNSN